MIETWLTLQDSPGKKTGSHSESAPFPTYGFCNSLNSRAQLVARYGFHS